MNNDAEKVLQSAVETAQQIFASRLIAAFALGSLAHGGFSPLVSDVDIALIIEDPLTTEDASKIAIIQNTVKNSSIPLAERTSIFWGSIDSLKNKSDQGRFPPLDKLDLIENGRLLSGKDIRNSLSKPTQAELVILGAKFAIDYLGTPEIVQELLKPELIYQQGVRHLTKIILFPVRLLYTAITGKIGHNAEAVTYYLANNTGKKSELIEAAFQWRSNAPNDKKLAVELMQNTLIELYVQFIDEYQKQMLEYNEQELAARLAEWKKQLMQ